MRQGQVAAGWKEDYRGYTRDYWVILEITGDYWLILEIPGDYWRDYYIYIYYISGELYLMLKRALRCRSAEGSETGGYGPYDY